MAAAAKNGQNSAANKLKNITSPRPIFGEGNFPTPVRAIEQHGAMPDLERSGGCADYEA